MLLVVVVLVPTVSLFVVCCLLASCALALGRWRMEMRGDGEEKKHRYIAGEGKAKVEEIMA
jgi:hypothetical protein